MRAPACLALAAALAAAPGRPAAQPPAPPAPVTSKLRVTVPQDDAELAIEGQPTKATGPVREFVTPPLDPGREYDYEFKVDWRPNNHTVMTRSRKVRFRAGDDIAADLTRDDARDKAVIRYVPTPPDIVAKMVELAGVGPDDVVYEPGCGDARITVAAVKAGAKRGVGVDLDPVRVKEAEANAAKAGLADRVEVRQGDALDIKDLGNATVVFLYMGDEFDALIRPVLWRQLKVGARVVSHRFTMGDWVPDRTVDVKGADGDDYQLHLWTVTDDVKRRAAK